MEDPRSGPYLSEVLGDKEPRDLFADRIQTWADTEGWHVYDYADRLLADLDAAGYEITRSAGEHGWAVVEVFGFKVLYGLVGEQDVAGVKFVRIESLTVRRVGEDDTEDLWETCLYNPAAVFSIRPRSEAEIRRDAPKSYNADEEPF
jgi:hypothetical protein